MSVMKLKLEIDFEYDMKLIHSNDEEGFTWFCDEVLLNTKPDEGLLLHSNLVGDSLGAIKVTRIISDANTLYETLKKDRRINNDFDYKRAKAKLRSLAKTYDICHGTGNAQKLQMFADAVDEYEKRTMT